MSDPNEKRSRETQIRRDDRGRWYEGNQEITHRSLRNHFDAWLWLAPDGRLALKNDINWAYIKAGKYPLDVTSLKIHPEDLSAELVTSGNKSESIVSLQIFVDGEGVLWTQVRQGIPARLSPSAQQSIERNLIQKQEKFCLSFGNKTLPLEQKEPPTFH